MPYLQHLHRVVVDPGPDTVPAAPPPHPEQRQRQVIAAAYQAGADDALNRWYPKAWRWGVVCGATATAAVAACVLLAALEWGWL